MKKVLLIILALSIVISCAAGFAACSSKDDENVITIRNLYFNDWDGSDDYTKMLEEKFGISFKVSSYSWSDWSEQVSGSVNARKLPNVFQDDVDSYNFANTYRFYAEDGDVKALPEDLSRWPNVKSLIAGIADIEHFKIDGKLYGIPVAKNIKGGSEDFAPFTYVYRRDWALELQSKLSFPVPADDVYNWAQFNELLNVFYQEKCGSGNVYALADVEWGFPSVINFYKDAPHCFVYGANGKVVSNYATDKYLQGLAVAKDLVDRQIYGYPQYESNEGDANKAYYGGRIGVFYENLSLTNYTTLRKQIKNINPKLSTEQINNMTAIMKVQGPDGKYTLEGQEDWFSMTFFSAKISDAKMEKILDIMDYLLSEEGTLFGLYGEEGYDYEKVRLDSGKAYDYQWNDTYGIKLLSWTKEAGTGNYVNPFNGARYLRYTCTLGYDIIDKDPLTDATAYPILKDWTNYMQAQERAGNLRVLREPAEVKWLATEKKSLYAGGMLEDANASVETYLYSEKPDLDKYIKEVTTGNWKTIIDEINAALGK